MGEEHTVVVEEHTLIMVAGYEDLDAARADFAELRVEIKHERFGMRAAMLVSKDSDGTPRVIDIDDHIGGTGVGVLAGLFAPPLLFATTPSPPIGTLVGRFAVHGVTSGLHHDIGQALAIGTGAVVAVLPSASRIEVERVLRHCPRTTTVVLAESTIATLEAAVAEEMIKISAIEAGVQAAL